MKLLSGWEFDEIRQKSAATKKSISYNSGCKKSQNNLN
jgi:hypothetical protein